MCLLPINQSTLRSPEVHIFDCNAISTKILHDICSPVNFNVSPETGCIVNFFFNKSDALELNFLW